MKDRRKADVKKERFFVVKRSEKERISYEIREINKRILH